MSLRSADTGHAPSLGTFPFVIGVLSFFPLLGVLFGFVAIGWGLVTKARGGMKLVFLGAGGIAFTVAIYSALFYVGFVQRGGIYDELRARMAQSNLNSLVQNVEFYRLSHGEYPQSLAVLAKSFPPGSIDTLHVLDSRAWLATGDDRYFYYRRVGADHYYLRGLAPDGKPFSPGALLPQVPSAKLGLLTDAPENAK